MRQTTKKYLFFSIILSMIIAGSVYTALNSQDKTTNNQNIGLESSADPSDSYLSFIRMEHLKGTDTIVFSLSGSIQSPIPTTLTTGLYNIKVTGLKFDENVVNVNSGLHKVWGVSGSVTGWTSKWGEAIAYSTLASVTFNAEAESSWYILPNNNSWTEYSDMGWSGNQGSIIWERSGSGGTAPLYFSTTGISLDYILYPILSIDSEDYGLHNVRVEVYRPQQEQWVEQDPNNLILNNPYYKLRIRDLQGNLLYEDKALQLFKSYRTIKIDSVLINNNSPETIRIIGANNGHFKGQYSFTEDMDYTRPDYLECSDSLEDCYVLPVMKNHAKVLYSNFDSSWLRVGLPFGALDEVSAEFYIYLTDNAKTQTIYLEGSSDFGALFVFHSTGLIRYYDSSGTQQNTAIPFSAGQWYHVRMEFERNNYLAYYLNGSLVHEESNAKDIDIELWKSQSPDTQEVYFDSLDFSFSPDYYTGRNLEINQSAETFSQVSCQNYPEEHYQGKDSYELLPDWSINTDYIADPSYATSQAVVVPQKFDYGFHSNMIYYGNARGYAISHNKSIALMSNEATGFKIERDLDSIGNYGNVEFWMFSPFAEDYSSPDSINVILRDSSGNSIAIITLSAPSGISNMGKADVSVDDATGTTTGMVCNVSHWNHWRLNFTCGSDLDIYLNDEAIYTSGQAFDYGNDVEDIVFQYTIGVSKNKEPIIWLNALDWSGTSEYYINRNQQYNSSYMNPSNFSALIQPYSSLIVPYTEYSDGIQYNITDIYGNEIKSADIDYESGSPAVIDYIPPNTAPVYIALEDQESNDLSFSDYRIQANEVDVYNNLLYLPINESVELELYDRFNNMLDSKTELIKRQGNVLNFTIEQYDLKILNLQKTSSAILINRTGIPDRNISEIIVSNEIFQSKLTPDLYNLYYLDENSEQVFLPVDVSQDTTIILNTSYRDVTFAIFDESGLGLDESLIRFYVNGQRKPVERVNVPSGISNLQVKDFFNATLYDADINLDLFTEYNIYVPIYTFFVGHNNSQTMEVVIERSDVTFTLLQQPIPPDQAIEFRFLAGIDYIVTLKYLNGTIHDSKTISLVANNEIVSFGFYEEPFRPSQETGAFPEYIVYILIAVVIVMIVVSIFQRNKIDKINKVQRYSGRSKSRTGMRPSKR